jgi:two-component system phosphate regulon sensor histidine kinase PhoR
VRASLFWKLGLSYLALLLLVLLAADLYASRALRRDYLNAAYERLDSLAELLQAQPPPLDQPAALAHWTAWAARSGARITVIASSGRVLADSAHDPETMENHANRPEILQAMAEGRGSAVRHSATLDRDLVYLAIRQQPAQGSTVVLRLALPLAQIDEALSEIRRRLELASLLLLLLGGAASLLVSRSFAARVTRLQEFSQRIADGDFRPLSARSAGDDLDQLTASLNATAAELDRTIGSLTDERNRSTAILQSMIEGVAVIDASETVRFCNPAFAEVLGTDAARCQGRPLLELVRQPELLDLVRQALGGRDRASGELTIGTLHPRSFEATAAPVRAEGAGGAVLVLHDVSELRRLERVRRDFVANVSHELRTPLTAIQGFAETLLAGALADPANNRRFLEIIRNHSLRLGRLTEDLLKLSQIEAGKMEMEFGSVAVAEMVAPCLETIRLRAGEQRLTLRVDCPADLPPVRGDAGRLREVLQNLLDNAVQYTLSGGSITVSACRRPTGGPPREVVVTVADTGIGIPEADQERIFERFYRVDAARSREVGGTGLGLSIARHIVEAHGGRIWVESAVRQGSHFHFSIPVAQ